MRNIAIEENDWIGIKVYLVDSEKNIIHQDLHGFFWLYITNEVIDREIRNLFYGKKKGDTLFASADFISNFLGFFFVKHIFCIVVEEHISHRFFVFENFKTVFNYDNKNTFEKIIEIFSLRNDISLKKEKAQLSLQFFLEKIKIYIDQDIIQEHAMILKNKLLKNADYLLYQGEVNFETNIKKLACRQSMEKILVDYLIYFYRIESSPALLYWYLNILQRPRLKEFLYFDGNYLYDTHHKSHLIHNVFIEQIALRERIIDYIIQKLS
jgi:hypothetical protein